ncbi:MAG: FtsX-like permease family protein [Actinomycetota bacterium]
MLKLSLRSIRSNLGRLILTTVAIVAGVSFVSGAFILTDSLEGTFDDIFQNAASGTDAQVAVAELDFGDDTRTIPDSLVSEVAALPEVGEASGTVAVDPGEAFRPFIVLNAAGEPVEPVGPPIITFSWDGEDQEGAIALASGSAPVGIDQVAIDSTYATAAGVTAGDTVTLVTPNGEQQFTLSGTFDIPITAGAYFVVFDFPSAQTLYGKEGQVDTIALSRAPGVSVEEMVAAVNNVIPPEATVQSQQEIIDESSAEFEQIINIFRYLLLAFAGIAVFVSLFIIYNTFQILISQRLQQIGMLRALGATKGQIRSGIVVESLIVGLAGSIVGIGFGWVVAELIKGVFQATGGFPETDTVWQARTIWVSLLVGMGATLVSALIPAWAAGRVTPIAAMRNESPRRSSFVRRVAIGAVVLVVGLVLLGIGLAGGDGTVAVTISALAIGAVLTFVGVALLSVLFAGPFVNLIGRSWVLGAALLGLGALLLALMFSGEAPSGLGLLTFPLKFIVAVVAVITGLSVLLSAATGRTLWFGGSAAGLTGRLARQNAARAPQRTAATATALTIGIALISTVGVVGESLKATFTDTLEQAIQADLFIFDEQTQGPFSGDLADELATVDGLAALSRYRFNEVRLGEDVESMAAFDTATGESLINLGVTAGDVAATGDNGVIVYVDAAEERGLSVGDTVSLEFPDLETEELTVSAIFEDSSVLSDDGGPTNWLIDIALYEQHIVNTDDVFVAALIDPAADPEAVKAEVVDIATEYSSVSAQDTAEFQESQEAQIDGLITLINALLAFALVVAFLGVINTIVLSVIERTREIGLLRAVGTTRTQIRSTIRWESVIVCLFGAVLGIALGVLFGAAAVSAIPDDIISTVAVPYESTLFAILAAALAGVVAALLPARRAAKLNVLDAISTTG